MSILIAEDDLTIQHLMATLLSRRGIPCTLVDNGRSAVDAWEENEFDLIFMDGGEAEGQTPTRDTGWGRGGGSDPDTRHSIQDQRNQ